PQASVLAWRSPSSSVSPGSAMVWWGLRMTTPLTLTRPAKIHCLARLFGVSGCFRSNQSNRGPVLVSFTTQVDDVVINPLPVPAFVGAAPQAEADAFDGHIP